MSELTAFGRPRTPSWATGDEPDAWDAAPEAAPVAQGSEFQDILRGLLALLGEDPDREGLVKTPERVENSLSWLTRGYALTPEDAVGDAVFAEGHHNMVLVRDIEMYSLCEHHLLPFFGRVHIAYVPDGRVVGLSKLPRIVEVFARRLQVQERLTEQVAQALMDVLRPRGVAVVVEAAHLCMMMRGVEKQSSKTITSAMKGVFLEDLRVREEFLRMIPARPSRTSKLCKYKALAASLRASRSHLRKNPLTQSDPLVHSTGEAVLDLPLRLPWTRSHSPPASWT